VESEQAKGKKRRKVEKTGGANVVADSRRYTKQVGNQNAMPWLLVFHKKVFHFAGQRAP
jgi:hypothetical protein